MQQYLEINILFWPLLKYENPAMVYDSCQSLQIVTYRKMHQIFLTIEQVHIKTFKALDALKRIHDPMYHPEKVERHYLKVNHRHKFFPKAFF